VCESYGIDFQNGASYFIDTNSNAAFTAVTEFSGQSMNHPIIVNAY